MNLTQEELTELQKRVKDWQDTPVILVGKVNLNYEAKKRVDSFSREMSIKYGYDYNKYAINSKTGEIKPL